jgi:serine/threonine protein kinase
MSELLKRRKKLSEPEARYYISQLVSSLLHLHDNLVIHRDLKLGNLFIGADMNVKVGDFGLATKLTHISERRKTVCGTPNYIAPEILEGKGHSFQVDTWSTGVILYTLLVGKPPFESKDVKSTYKRILANSYSFPDHTPISSSAKKLITELLKPRPEDRPALDSVMAFSFFQVCVIS